MSIFSYYNYIVLKIFYILAFEYKIDNVGMYQGV